MKKTKFLSVIAVGALLFGTGLTSCAQEPETEYIDVHHYGVSITTTTGGTVTTSTETAKEGEDVTLTVTPETNFSLTSLKINGEEKATEVKDNKLTVKVGKGALKVQATFAQKVYKVNIGETTNGAVVSSIAEGTTGTSFKITVTPNPGFEVETFTVDGVDKKTELVSGTFETTIGSADIAVAVTFKALSAETLVSDFIAKTKKASEIETSGALNKLHYLNVSSMTTDTTYEKFQNESEGVFNLLTETRKNAQGKTTTKSVKKTILKEESLYTITQSYKVDTNGEISSDPSSTELSTSAGTSIESNSGNGYLGKTLFSGAGNFAEAKLKGAKNLKITFEGTTTKVSYDALAKDWMGVETYTLTEGSFTFDGERITKAVEKVSTYSSGFTKDESGNVTIEEGATPKVQSKEFTLEYGEVQAEPQSLVSLKYGELATTKITPTYFEIGTFGTEEINDLSALLKTHSYKIKLVGDKDKVLDPLSYELVGDYGEDTSNVMINYSSFSNEITINSKGTFSGSLILSTFNAKLTIPLVVIEPTLESIELGVPNYSTGTLDKTASIKVGETLDLSLTVNPLGSNDKVAFDISGSAAEGCKVISQEYYGQQAYTFTPGTLTGEVTVKAISTVDSSIVSNDLVITIEDGSQPQESLITQIPGFYQSAETEEFYLTSPLSLGELSEDPEGGYAGEYTLGATTGTYFFTEDGMGAFVSFGAGVNLELTNGTKSYVYTAYGFNVGTDAASGSTTLVATGIMCEDETAPILSDFTLVKIY